MNAVPPDCRSGRPRRATGASGRVSRLPTVVAVMLVIAGCATPPPSPSAMPTVPSASDEAPSPEPPEADPLEDLVMLVGKELFLGDADGGVKALPGPGGPVEAASAASGTIVVQTAGATFHVATVPANAGGPLAWRAIEIDPSIAARPLSLPALSPHGTRLALLAAVFGNAEPFEVVIAELSTDASGVLPVDREPNGPAVWLNDSEVLLETVASEAGGPFIRLDSATGMLTPTMARGVGPAVAGDGSIVAVLADGSVVTLPVEDWLGGAELDTATTVGAATNAIRLAVDAVGRRIAFDITDDGGDPLALSIYVRGEGGWSLSGSIDRDPAAWFGWLR